MIFRTPRHYSIACLVCVFLLLVGGCGYRVDIKQGHIIEPEVLEQLRQGQSVDEVLNLLGTPFIYDPFYPQRWEYVMFSKNALNADHLTLWFEQGKLMEAELNDELLPGFLRRKSP